jgi:3-keto-5-aminohexanoate cleavage enzyme
MGGHCRVGLEDNIYHDFHRAELATNHGLVDRIAFLAETFGRELASPARARVLMGLGPSAARLAEPEPMLVEAAG